MYEKKLYIIDKFTDKLDNLIAFANKDNAITFEKLFTDKCKKKFLNFLFKEKYGSEDFYGFFKDFSVLENESNSFLIRDDKLYIFDTSLFLKHFEKWFSDEVYWAGTPNDEYLEDFTSTDFMNDFTDNNTAETVEDTLEVLFSSLGEVRNFISFEELLESLEDLHPVVL